MKGNGGERGRGERKKGGYHIEFCGGGGGWGREEEASATLERYREKRPMTKHEKAEAKEARKGKSGVGKRMRERRKVAEKPKGKVDG